jgi:glutaminyl-tRNA synthetase
MSDSAKSNFLTDIIDADLASNIHGGKVVTRFPPEPNGWLHLGHAKSILLNFGLGKQYPGGRTHMRFDDTNPTTEEVEYVQSIMNDAKWLGADWGDKLFYASDFFEQMYACAERLIRDGKAYVDDQDGDAISATRGDFNTPGTNSPFRGRTVEENLALFRKMRAGEFKDGACVLRGKVDMTHPNVLMRDPLLYRIRHAHHHRTGNTWCIYPMYDYAHPLEDAFEGITHSICTLEFETHRELYDWVLDNLGPWNPRPHQYEFARLALGYTVMSKRKLLRLVNDKLVSGWDDPRMPTLAGMRRRGITPEALRDFAELIGVAKNNSLVDIGKFEFAIRSDLEKRTPRAMAVLHPLKVTLANWTGPDEVLTLPWWQNEPEKGARAVPFGRELFIDREDFAEAPPSGWKRLAPGAEVRLQGAYAVKVTEVKKDASGAVVELVCAYDPATKGGATPEGKKIAGVIHWVPASAPKAEVRLYDRLFKVELPDAEEDFITALNPESLQHAPDARVEPALLQAKAGERFQFLRTGYFFVDPKDSKPGAPVFNRTITLKDTWAKPAAAVERKPEPKEPKHPSSAPKKSRSEHRDELRAQTPALAAAHVRALGELKLSADEADLLTGDLALWTYVEAALPHAPAKAVAKWATNELLGAVKEQPLDKLPLSGADFGKFVGLIEAGRVSASSAKELLVHLVAHGGDPAAALATLGLQKTNSTAGLDAAVAGALQPLAAEVARYRAGEKKLLGLFMGAVRKATGSKYEPGDITRELNKQLG